MALTALALIGCGAGLSDEHKRAAQRVQELGGQVNYERGGYEVSLNGTGVENADLAVLKNIPNLKHLDLRSTHIDDEGIVHLAQLTTLRDLQLSRTQVSRDGFEKLKQSLPDTYIER